MKDNLDLGLKLLVAFAASLTIYVNFMVVGDRVSFGIEEKTMMYNHDMFIEAEIIKRAAIEQIAKGDAFKYYMETADASKMVELDMVLVNENGVIIQDINQRFQAKTEAYKYFKETGDNSKIIKYMEK